MTPSQGLKVAQEPLIIPKGCATVAGLLVPAPLGPPRVLQKVPAFSRQIPPHRKRALVRKWPPVSAATATHTCAGWRGRSQRRTAHTSEAGLAGLR